MKARHNRRALMVAAFLACLGLAGFLEGGLPASAAPGYSSYLPPFDEVSGDKGEPFLDGCMLYTDAVYSPPCRYGVVGSKKQVVLLGDSHASMWAPALIGVAEKRGWQATVLTRKECTAALVGSYPACQAWRRNILQRIERERPGLVLVANNTAFNAYVMQRGRRLSRASSEPLFRQGLIRTLQRLRRSGTAVSVMVDIPTALEFFPPNCVAENPANPRLCDFPARRPDSRSYDLVAARRVPGVKIIDPLGKLCPGGTCRSAVGNILTYRNHGHITATYSRYLAPWLQARLGDPFRAR